MAEVAARPMTFAEFTELRLDGRYELVNGKVDELVSPLPPHSFTGVRLPSILDHYLEEHQPDAYWGVELDIPTIPFYGRRPDFAYYTPEQAARSVEARRVLEVPTLVVEVLSEDDEARDLVVKRREYARAGIAHYWIVDPRRWTVLTLELADGEYVETARLGADDTLTSPLFPGLEVRLRRVFRSFP
jgi:Uma2 family endonuclease